MIVSNYEYRLRARASLGGSIFSGMWLMAVLAYAIMGAASSIVAPSVIGIFLIFGPLQVGMSAIYLGIARGKGAVDPADFLKGFLNDYVDNLLLGVISMVKIFLWSLLFVIPGIAKAYSYAMIYYIKNDHPQYNHEACMKESERIMSGHRMRLLLLDLSFIGWAIVGAMCFGIGTLWVGAYIETTRAQFYLTIR
jgi:uncharacterized membrane protein